MTEIEFEESEPPCPECGSPTKARTKKMKFEGEWIDTPSTEAECTSCGTVVHT